MPRPPIDHRPLPRTRIAGRGQPYSGPLEDCDPRSRRHARAWPARATGHELGGNPVDRHDLTGSQLRMRRPTLDSRPAGRQSTAASSLGWRPPWWAGWLHVPVLSVGILGFLDLGLGRVPGWPELALSLAAIGLVVLGVLSLKSQALGPALCGPCPSPGPEKRVALTFDDGPDPRTTPRVLEALGDARVTFFVSSAARAAVRWPPWSRRSSAASDPRGYPGCSPPARATIRQWPRGGPPFRMRPPCLPRAGTSGIPRATARSGPRSPCPLDLDLSQGGERAHLLRLHHVLLLLHRPAALAGSAPQSPGRAGRRRDLRRPGRSHLFLRRREFHRRVLRLGAGRGAGARAGAQALFRLDPLDHR